MTTYYVGPGGNDANNGTTWALRKLTLNGAENIPVAANDTVYVGPGTYRELLTVDVSGAAGQPITYIGDYTGANTDGIGGIVRITGSDNDQVGARTVCITSNNKAQRTVRGFLLDMATTQNILLTGGSDNWIIDECAFGGNETYSDYAIYSNQATPTNITIQNCAILPGGGGINIYNVSDTAASNLVVQNCLMVGAYHAVLCNNVSDVVIKNCTAIGCVSGGFRAASLAVAASITVNNCFVISCGTGLWASAAGELVEDYNVTIANTTDRTNVAAGANSLGYVPLFDTRWFFEAVNGGRMISPWDLASYSQLINVAGASPTTTDLRGTAAIGGQREWGALEYDATLLAEGAAAGNVNLLRGKL